MSKSLKNKRPQYLCLSAMVIANAIHAVPAYAGGTACIQSNISIIVVSQPLNFASLAPCAGSGGTVTVSPLSARSTTGCNTSISGTVAAARVRVIGNNHPSKLIRVTVTNANSAVINSGTQTMLVNNITMNPGGTSQTFTANKSTTIDVGGTLNHGAGQAAGTYTGAFTVNAVCF